MGRIQNKVYFMQFLSTNELIGPTENDDQCDIFKKKWYKVTYLFIIAISFELVIFYFLIYFYYHIWRAIKEDIDKSDQCSNIKRIYFLRLVGYSLVFLVLILFNTLDIAQTFEVELDKAMILFKIRIMIVAVYPLLNSLIYGCTRSSRRYMLSLFGQIPDYKKQEEMLYALRNDGILRDRWLFDIANISESQLFEQQSINTQ